MFEGRTMNSEKCISHNSIDPSAKPKLYRVRPVPCALKSKTEDELSSLVKLRIYLFVSCDKYLAPKTEHFRNKKWGKS